MTKSPAKSKASKYPRDLVGYGRRLPDPKWPGQARLALQISLNYEAGGELNVLHGDRVSEAMLTDIGFPAVKGARSPLVESSFEYGSRRGVWRRTIGPARAGCGASGAGTRRSPRCP